MNPGFQSKPWAGIGQRFQRYLVSRSVPVVGSEPNQTDPPLSILSYVSILPYQYSFLLTADPFRNRFRQSQFDTPPDGFVLAQMLRLLTFDSCPA